MSKIKKLHDTQWAVWVRAVGWVSFNPQEDAYLNPRHYTFNHTKFFLRMLTQMPTWKSKPKWFKGGRYVVYLARKRYTFRP